MFHLEGTIDLKSCSIIVSPLQNKLQVARYVYD